MGYREQREVAGEDETMAQVAGEDETMHTFGMRRYCEGCNRTDIEGGSVSV